MSCRVLIADAHETVLTGLISVLESAGDLAIVGVGRSGPEAIRLAREVAPDVVILGLSLPGIGGFDATRQIAVDHRVLCLSMHSDRQYMVAALEAGAAGYLLKDRVSEGLIQAVREVAAGRRYLDPELGPAL